MDPVYMNNKNFIKLLKEDYEDAYSDIKNENNFSYCFKYLRKRNMQYGLCFYAQSVYNRVITNARWVIKHVKHNELYWHQTPNQTLNLEELKKAIIQRIETMNLILDEL